MYISEGKILLCKQKLCSLFSVDETEYKNFKDIHLDSIGLVYVFPYKVYNTVFSPLSQWMLKHCHFS